MLIDRDDLKRWLASKGRISEQSADTVDEELLDVCVAGANDGLTSAAPDRTLEPLPALRNAGTAEVPDWVDDVAPVELELEVARIVQVPDLRELVAIRVDDRVLWDDTADPPVTFGGVVQPRLRPRRRGTPALWLYLPYRPDGSSLYVSGRWGPADSTTLEVAGHVRQAALEWAAAAYQRRNARGDEPARSPAGGPVVFPRRRPPSVQAVIDDLLVPGL